MLHGNVVDQLHDDDRLADAGTPEEARLAALHIGGEQVDDLDPRLEDLRLGLEVVEARRQAMDRPPLDWLVVGACDRTLLVDRLAEDIENPAQRRLADGHRDGAPRVHDIHAPLHAVGRAHRHGANLGAADVLLHLGNQVDLAARFGLADKAQRVVDLRQMPRVELHVQHGSDDLDDSPDVVVSHVFVFSRRLVRGVSSFLRSITPAPRRHPRSRRSPG